VVVVRPDAPRSRDELRRRAAEQLARELSVIAQLDLDEFFLVVHEIVEEARRRDIRCAGRGSAANSIVAYLLGITGVDPIEHRLLFERFLHAGRRGTPDIDVDFDSERRDEIIAWMENRFGIEQTAMTATLITYRSRLALRDTAKALGWPPEVVDRMSKAVPPHWGTKDLSEYRVRLERIVGASPLLQVLLDRATDLQGAPRHLGLHSGGMILSRKPLWHFSPVQVSANGVSVVQFDKDDVEALGLVKFDVLGLRMLACLSEAVEIGTRHDCFVPGAPGVDREGTFDVDELSLDDAATYNLMRSSKTLGVFQIESQGQLHLLAQHQPEDFIDIINEIALFRPGPLQSGMVHPFVQRRRGLKPVEYPHPDLEPILGETYGVIVFQEQVLEVAHHFARMSLDEADEFRRLMSKFRDPGQMEGMRERFVSGAVAHGVDPGTATAVFENVSKFVGYGFCRSHAAAFAKTVYQSAWMKTHYPAAFMAAFLQHRPGMYNLMTLEEECRRFGVEVLLPDVNRSGARYDLERMPDGRLAIRKPLTAIQGMSEEHAREIVWERLNGLYRTVQDFYERVALDADLFDGVARSGALDALAGTSRRALWEMGLMERRLAAPGSRAALLFEAPAFSEDDVPELPPLTAEERFAWDYQVHGAARAHPMTLVRRTLGDYEIRPIATCWGLGRAVQETRDGPVVTIAGIAMLRQRPPTANGVLFLTLEDETGFIQCFVYPKVLEALDHVVSQASLIVRGKLQVMGNWRGLVMHHAWPLNGILGGYEGHPSMAGGRDRMITATEIVTGRSVPAS
jgi:error-prone DNA polymerase